MCRNKIAKIITSYDIRDIIKEDERVDAMHITGVKVAYYFICHTKLWLFSHNITMERENDYVALGKIIHENSYRGHNEIQIGDIAIDYIRKGETIEIHEIKKSSAMENASKMQVLYYLYYLKSRGVIATGVIDYPKLKKRITVELTPESEEKVKNVLTEIEKTISGPMPPPKRKKICKKCAYYEFCFGGDE